MQYDDFDYFAWWKNAVKVNGVSPKDAWDLDYCELLMLGDFKSKSTQDGSFMVNAQRRMNGMSQEEVFNEH